MIVDVSNPRLPQVENDLGVLYAVCENKLIKVIFDKEDVGKLLSIKVSNHRGGLMTARWHKNINNNVIQSNCGKKAVNLNYVILGIKKDKRYYVRHINGNPFDFRKSNLVLDKRGRQSRHVIR